MDIVVATRSQHKLQELSALLSDVPGIRLIDLDQAGIRPTPEEDVVEAFETFEENALAKARFFAARCESVVLADDSGLCVDALGGAPGVYSKRYSGRSDLRGLALDEANNERLLRELGDLPEDRRTASYVCALALISPGRGEELFRGTVEGRILAAPRGNGGFGYDPLFFVPSLGATFAEIPAAEKNRLSHRGRAAAHAAAAILELLSDGSPGGSKG